MSKILPILSRILMIVGALTIVGINLVMGYIMFAPDSLPKPFYLMYQNPGEQSQAASGDQTAAGVAATHPLPVTTAVTDPADKDHPLMVTPRHAPLSSPIEIKPGQGLMIDTGTKIVNLVDPTGRRYLRVGMVLEFAPSDLSYYTLPEEERMAYVEEFNLELTTKLPVINDVIITLLSSKSFEAVYTAEGKELLRQEIMDTINMQIPEHRVIFVYFTEFVVQ